MAGAQAAHERTAWGFARVGEEGLAPQKQDMKDTQGRRWGLWAWLSFEIRWS